MGVCGMVCVDWPLPCGGRLEPPPPLPLMPPICGRTAGSEHCSDTPGHVWLAMVQLRG